MTTDLALPTSSDMRGWTPQEFALMSFAGLVTPPQMVPNPRRGEEGEPPMVQGPRQLVDAGVAEAFLALARRTGLDPFAKQIYAVQFGGKWSVVVGIDGFRIVAQRSEGYAGQVGPQWTDGTMVPKLHPKTGATIGEEMRWLDAWTDTDKPPAAARIGILRKGWKEPLWQVVTWQEFGANAQGPNWKLKTGRPAHMLGIRAESHGLRRAFPNDLSGLYTPEDIDHDGAALTADVDAERIATVNECADLAELERLYHAWKSTGLSDSVNAAIMTRAGALRVAMTEDAPSEAPADAGEPIAEPADENPSEPDDDDAQGQQEPQGATSDEEPEDVRLARSVMPAADFAQWMKTRSTKGKQ